MWEYGERYNADGEFNPRLIMCHLCSVYHEPDDFPADVQYGCEECSKGWS